MKVLLLGEYSGFFTNLRAGFRKIGIECNLASGVDGFKRIDGADIKLFGNLKGKNIFAKIFNLIIYPFINIHKLYGYDVVYMVSASPFYYKVNRYFFKKIKKHNRKIYVSVAGASFELFRAYDEGKLGYYTFDDNPEAIEFFDYKLKKNKQKYDNELYVYGNVDGIIPVMYEYAVGVKNRSNCKKTIILPFDYTTVDYVPNIVKGKIRIAHGILKEKYKGTNYIIDAFEILKKKYPNEIEIIIPPKMPLKEYKEFLKTINILVDQCKEHCYGLNALYAMATGRIVLGGASINSLKELEIAKCPVIHIEPNVDMIVDKIEELIKHKDKFIDIGRESREYVENYHDCGMVAKEYFKLWTE